VEAARRADAADSAVGGAARGLVVGAGGYMGPPKAGGAVEIGYSIVPERRRRGYAREAVDGWLAHAFADPRVGRVLAHTLPALAPSIAVLRSAGFVFGGAGADPQAPSAARYVLTREAYDQPGCDRAPFVSGRPDATETR
jgi:RimJ/RimL family protein N-acetyltransferase